MYQVIKNHPNSLKLYEEKLLGTSKVSKEDVQRIHDKVNPIWNEELAKSKDYVPNKRDWLAAYWTGFNSPEKISCVRNTGVKQEVLKLFMLTLAKLLSFYGTLHIQKE